MYNVTDDDVLKWLDYDSYFTLQDKRLPDTIRAFWGVKVYFIGKDKEYTKTHIKY